MSDGARTRVIRIALAIWVGTFIAFLGTTVTTFNEPLRVVAFWAYGLPVVLAAAYALTRRLTSLDLAVLVALAACLIVAWLSSDRIAGLESTGLAIAYASTLIVAAHVTAASWRWPIAVGVSLPVSVWMLVFAVVWIADRLEWVALGGGVPPHIAQSAHLWLGTDLVAVLLLLAVPFYPVIRRTAVRRVLIAVTLLAAVAVVPMTDARTTWIAGVLGIVVLAALTPHVRSQAWPTYRLPILIVGMVMIAGGVATIVSGAAGTLSGRANIWATAVATFTSSPIIGTGPGTFSWARLTVTAPLLEPYPVFQAHNIVLQTLAEGGLILLAGLAVAVTAWVGAVGRSVPTLGSRSRLALAVLVAFGVVVLFDDPLQLPALAAMAFTLAGWVAADAGQRRAVRARGVGARRAAAAALLVAGAATVPATFAASEARTAAAEGRAAALNGDWKVARDAFSRASELWPSRAPYELGLGLASAHLGDAAEARSHYESAERLSPGDPRPPGALAALTRDPEERVSLLRDAAQLMSRDPQYRYRLAAALLETGHGADAILELSRAAIIDPQILTLIEREWNRLTFDSVLEAIPGVLVAEADLMAVDPMSVTAQVDIVRERIDAANPPALVAVVAARMGEPSLAVEWLDRALMQEPHAQRTYDVGVAIAEARCDADEARRQRRLGEIAPGGVTSLYRVGQEIQEARDHVYREMGLGDYQPPAVDRPAVSPYEWPQAFLAGIGCVGESGES